MDGGRKMAAYLQVCIDSDATPTLTPTPTCVPVAAGRTEDGDQDLQMRRSGRIQFKRVRLSEAGTLYEVGGWLQQNAADLMRFGVYSDGVSPNFGGMHGPQDRLWQSPVLVSNAGFKSSAAAGPYLMAGTYWIGLQAQGGEVYPRQAQGSAPDELFTTAYAAFDVANGLPAQLEIMPDIEESTDVALYLMVCKDTLATATSTPTFTLTPTETPTPTITNINITNTNAAAAAAAAPSSGRNSSTFTTTNTTSTSASQQRKNQQGSNSLATPETHSTSQSASSSVSIPARNSNSTGSSAAASHDRNATSSTEQQQQQQQHGDRRHHQQQHDAPQLHHSS
jgi:hypothetical protein